MTLLKEFNSCVEQITQKDGSLKIICLLGLWAVEGKDHAKVMSEARHYWYQYYTDGEYNQLLKSK